MANSLECWDVADGCFRPELTIDCVPECQKYLDVAKHRRLYRLSSDDYREPAGIWSNHERALPRDPPGNLAVVDGVREGGKFVERAGNYGAFAPDYAWEENFRNH